MAENFPGSSITAVSNSHSQKKYIDGEAARRHLSNIRVITADINDLALEKKFDRIVSVEMFEHMRNYRQLLKKINEWLQPDGLLFVHIFVHKHLSYKFEVKDESDWMSKYFFSGGMMPGDRLLYHFDDHLSVKKHWRVNGIHYAKTAEAWLSNMDNRKKEVLSVLNTAYGAEALKWRAYWRIFFMSCAELWHFRNGEEWFVSHYLLEKNNSR
jgi:cyclopropane-fatty-acyl-phospholipid synthase